MRLALAGLSHEANTFAPVAAELVQWRQAGILTGDEIRAVHGTAHSIVAGQLAYGAEEAGATVVPLVYSEITPMAASTAAAFDHLAALIVAAIHDGGPWDGVLLALHGAAVSERFPDADGQLVAMVRATVGPAVPIAVTLDMHANVSPRLASTADVITMYQTNPHVDAYDQGLTAARLLGRTVRGEIRPALALADPPLAVNILRQGTGDEPMAGILRGAREHEQRPGVLGVFVAEGFPYADVPQMGMSVVAMADGDSGLARDVARSVAGDLWAVRPDLTGDAIGVDEAILRAADADRSPVVVLDTGDNVFGGSPGDSTHLLHAARRHGVRGVVSLVTDPAAAATCASSGTGSRVALQAGGKTDDWHGAPLAVAGVVSAVSDGKFEDPTPTHGGSRYFDLGLTARLSTDDGFELVLTSRPLGTISLEQLRIVGLEPAGQRIIVAKGVHSPRAAYEPIAAELIWAGTPGCTSADLSTFTYRRRRRPMFPFEPDAEYPHTPSHQ